MSAREDVLARAPAESDEVAAADCGHGVNRSEAKPESSPWLSIACSAKDVSSSTQNSDNSHTHPFLPFSSGWDSVNRGRARLSELANILGRCALLVLEDCPMVNMRNKKRRQDHTIVWRRVGQQV